MTCDASGTVWGSCSLDSCDLGYALQAGACVPPIVVACPGSSSSCAEFTGRDGSTQHVWLSDGKRHLTDSEIMGDLPQYFGHRLAYVYATDDQTFPFLYILDVTQPGLVGWLGRFAEYTVYNTYFGYVTDPDGHKYPFMAPGSHYLDDSAYGGKPNPGQWDSLCIFDPAYIAAPSPSCYTGFKPYPATFTTPSGKPASQASGFRHNGGWVQDLDGDGWGDINLPFLSYIPTISGRTGEQLGLTHIDPAAPVATASCQGFDSGRFYGAFTALSDESGQDGVLVSAANAVGTFADVNCNVSRYFMLARWDGSGFTPVWDYYLGFGGAVFNPPSDVVGACTDIAPRHMTGCTHRFGNSLEWVSGRPTIIFNTFIASDTSLNCAAEWQAYQTALSLGQDATDLHSAFLACADATSLPAPGRWLTRFIDAWTGELLGQAQDRYVWGRATRVMPDVADLLLVQNLSSNGGVVAFNQTGASPDSFSLVQLTGQTTWDVVTSVTAPSAAPRIWDPVGYYGAYAPGMGATWGGLPELVLQDLDGDGLNEIQLQDDQWLGYSPATGSLIIKR